MAEHLDTSGEFAVYCYGIRLTFDGAEQYGAQTSMNGA
jgi:hypothetical protein